MIAPGKMRTTDNAPSPKWLLNFFKDCFDPCPSVPAFNGLKISWAKKNYVNPPYSVKVLWIKKAINEMQKGNKSFLFLPVDTSTNWFWNLVFPNFYIYFFTKRIRLGNGHRGKFASIICESKLPTRIQIPSSLPNLRTLWDYGY